MLTKARCVVLPAFTLTSLCEPSDPGALHTKTPFLSSDCPSLEYYRRPVERQYSLFSESDTYSYNRLPIVLNGDGSPWTEANLYLLSRLESDFKQNMATYHGIGDDLAEFRRYLEDEELDFTQFHRRKLHRPTYRYRGFLRLQIELRKISPNTARRRMGSVIRFYRWLINEALISPEHPPWSDTDALIKFTNTYGFSFFKEIKTTNLAIRAPKSTNPFDGTIFDSGKLKPLSPLEQGALVESLVELGNTQMLLIHLLALFSGARIQSVLTFQVHHMQLNLPEELTEIRIPVGPGTGIDTKYDKRLTLFIPRWLYEKLRLYTFCQDAQKRRARAENYSDEQYLFLSNRGTPLYTSRQDQTSFNAKNSQRYLHNGESVRQYISARVIPLIRKKLEFPTFRYKFHDLRATYGMNLTDQKMQFVRDDKITFHQAREFVKARMGHESHQTTDIYLNYRQSFALIHQAQTNFEKHLEELVEVAMENSL